MIPARNRGARASLGSALCVALALGCSINPVSRRPEVSFISTEREAELGAEAAKQVAQQMGLVEDERVLAYVRELGNRIAEHSPRQDVEYTFQIVDMVEPNAFALPGGYVYVSRGLLALANDEAEVANVVGHEIAHVAARHAAQRQTRAVGVGIALLPAALIGATLGMILGTPGDIVSATVNTPLALAGVGLIAAYSRDQEREADSVGQKMVSEAGIDPHGMPHFMHTLEEYEKLATGEVRQASFFASHPTTPERVENTAKRAEMLEWEPQPAIAGTRKQFLARLQGLLVDDNPAEGIFEDDLFLHPDLGFTIRFPAKWKTVNARNGVGAFAPEKDGQIVLELQSEGDDPTVAASALFEKLGQQMNVKLVEAEELRISGYPAYRADVVLSRGSNTVPVTMQWIAKDGMIYRITGAAPTKRYASYQPLFRKTQASFKTLTPEQRSSIVEHRLGVVSATGGETLEALNQRSGNQWSVEQTNVANQIEDPKSLKAGFEVKVSLPRPYVSKPR